MSEGSSSMEAQPSKGGKIYQSKSDETFEVFQNEKTELTGWNKFKDSFKQADPNDLKPAGPMSKRHLRLISLATGLGTGLLVGSGGKLRTAGPLFLLVAYFIVGVLMLQPTIFSAGELSVAYPTLPGGFQSYYKKFICPSAAFALGWLYLIQWASVVSLELVTASMTIKYWNTSINSDVFVAIFLVVVVAINLCGARGYAEAEFVMNTTKLLMLTGFIIFGLVADLGGTKHGFVGGRYWRDPGSYTSFKGLCTVFCASAFSFGGSEFVALSVADQANPRGAMKSACKLIILRVIIFFMGSLLFVGLLVPYTSDQLLGSGGSATHASPFVIAAETYGSHALSSIVNAVILISVTSVATAAMYSSPRLLLSLAEQGMAPKIFTYVDKTGRPLYGWYATIVASFFCFIATYEKQETVFNWLLSISGICFLFVWPAICYCHVRFRYALKLKGIPLTELGYVSPTGIWGSYISIIINILMLIAQFWVALFPGSEPDANSFFQNYLGGVVLLVLYGGHKLWTRNWRWLIPLEEIDVNQDRALFDSEVMALEREEEKERFKKANIFKKFVMLIS
ncbi:valine amino-acid permease [[Candida] jaroonii]|uniref:Valine amino-acid permease n=1 Tax=[Candida] jaroonii TaxID=467808 RepID=A0ACA9Y1F1_9ASCO|nr:valine amino-acid permease [[Candida] jaroonii]